MSYTQYLRLVLVVAGPDTFFRSLFMFVSPLFPIFLITRASQTGSATLESLLFAGSRQHQYIYPKLYKSF